MKKYLFVMLFAAFFISCDDDVDPDLTKAFVGSWKGQIKKEVGYEYGTDWVISKVDDKTIKIVSTYKLVSTTPKVPSSTSVTNIDNIMVSSIGGDKVTMNMVQEYVIPGDTISVKGTGVVSGDSLIVSSTGISKKTGKVSTPPIQRFKKQ